MDTPRYLTLEEAEAIGGRAFRPSSIRARKHRGKPTPVPVYEMQGCRMLFVKEEELRAYLKSLQPVTKTEAEQPVTPVPEADGGQS